MVGHQYFEVHIKYFVIFFLHLVLFWHSNKIGFNLLRHLIPLTQQLRATR